MNEFRADLHCHSTCSDGTVAPEDLIKMAIEMGLSGLSITDHDTIEAYATAFPLAQKLGLQMIPGVEFSAMLDGISVHLLAYSFPLEDSLMKNFCQRHTERRKERNREILKRLTQAGMPLTEEEVLKFLPSDSPISLGRPHIALAMQKKGYIQNIQEAFNKYIGQGKSCYFEGETFSTEETLDIIHQSRGLAVIAHPHLISHSKILKKLLEMEFDGIECYYARFNKEANEHWLKIAEHHHLFVTGGSDYHGDIKPNIALGASWIDQDRFQILKQHFNEVSHV